MTKARFARHLGISPTALRAYLREAKAGRPCYVNEATFLKIKESLKLDHPEALLWQEIDRDRPLTVAALVPNLSNCPPKLRDHFRITESFLAYIMDRTKGFVGRKFVFSRIDSFLEERASGYFVIHGEPGIGKTAIIARRVEEKREVFHFNSESMGINTTDMFLTHVCAQMIVRFHLDVQWPENFDRDGALFFHSTLAQAAQRIEHGQRLVILIDALDELATNSSSRTANPLFLPPVLPQRVYVVITTKEPIDSQRLNMATCVHLELKHDSEGNVADAKQFVETRLSDPKVTTWVREHGYKPADFVATLLERSDHNFMYLSHVLAAIAEGDLKDFDVKNLPVGLQGYYRFHWSKMQHDVERFEDDYKPVVCVLASLPRMLTIDEIAQRATLPFDRVAAILAEWRRRTYVRQEEDAKGELRYQLYHRPFKEFLAKEVDEKLRDHRRKIIDVVYKRLKKPPELNS